MIIPEAISGQLSNELPKAFRLLIWRSKADGVGHCEYRVYSALEAKIWADSYFNCELYLYFWRKTLPILGCIHWVQRVVTSDAGRSSRPQLMRILYWESNRLLTKMFLPSTLTKQMNFQFYSALEFKLLSVFECTRLLSKSQFKSGPLTKCIQRHHSVYFSAVVNVTFKLTSHCKMRYKSVHS